MLDRLRESPLLALGFILLVVYLAAIYVTNRTRAKVAQMRGPRRFQPEWRSGRTARRRRKPSHDGGFSPEWNSRREGRRLGAGGESVGADVESSAAESESTGGEAESAPADR